MLSLFNVSDDFTALSINIKCLSRIELGIVIDEDRAFKILGGALRKLAVTEEGCQYFCLPQAKVTDICNLLAITSITITNRPRKFDMTHPRGKIRVLITLQ